MSTRTIPRRRALRLFAATPLAIAGCGAAASGADSGAGRDGGLADGGLADGGGGFRDGGLLADAGSDAALCRASERDALGPFFEDGSPTRTLIAALDEPGDRLFVEGSLVDVADCARPLSGYVVDVWQADVDGAYHAANSSDFRLRGRVVTGADGRFAFETIKPGFYETGAGPRPAHLHVRVYTADGVDRLVTQLYFAGDEFLGLADGCQPPTCFSGDPDRILDLEPTRVSGRDGLLGRVRLVVPA